MITKAFADSSDVSDATTPSINNVMYWLRNVFAERRDAVLSKSMGQEYSWAVDKINQSPRLKQAENDFSDNKTLLTLLCGLALFPTDAGVYHDTARVLIDSNWSINITDAIYDIRQNPSVSDVQSLNSVRLMLCSSMVYASQSIRFSTTEAMDKSDVIENLLLNTLQMLTLDAKLVLQQTGVPTVKTSVVSALPPALVEVSSKLSISTNVLCFLLSLVSEYLIIANLSRFYLTSKVYKVMGGNVYTKCVVEGLQEILAIIVPDRLNDNWVKFYRMLILHDFSKQMDKQRKKFMVCDHLIDQAMPQSLSPVPATLGSNTSNDALTSQSVYEIVCVDDLLNEVVDIVYTTRAMGNHDETSDLLEQIFYWEAIPFNIPGDLSYQNTYRHLFHLEKNALERMSSADIRTRGMMRLARISHLIFSSTHNESNERSKFMQCVMLESPELAVDLPAMIKALYESGRQRKCPSAFFADIIDLSTFSNKNEHGYLNRPISISSLEVILKQQFQQLSMPNGKSMAMWLLHKRNYSACLFVQLWGLAAWGQRNGHIDNESLKNIWNEFIKLNGNFNEQNKTWIPGLHDNESDNTGSMHTHDDEVTLNDDVLVFSRPGDMDWCDSNLSPPSIPCLLRRKFDDIDEANVELGEDELFVLQPVYGRIVHVNDASSDCISGYVSVEGMHVHLPFSISSEYEVSLLEANNKAPFLHQRCSFYVGFRRTKAFALFIQSAIDDNDRVSLYDLQHAERIGRSNNPLYQPRMIRERPFRSKMLMNSDGLNFMDFGMKSAPAADIQKVFSLADSDYSDLTKDYMDTNSIPIQLLSSKEFDMDSLESMVALQRRIYGRLNFLCSALHTPYESFDVLPNKSTGWIAVPINKSSNGLSESSSLFPWIEKNIVDPDYLDKQIHWIARDVVSLFVDKALKFGASKPSRKVSPQRMDLIDSATEGFCRKMFLFVSLPKLSLVAVPKGILVLREQSQGGTGHFFDLGILYFDNKTVHDTRNYLTTIWRRAVGCILSSNWQYLGDVDSSIDDSVEKIAKRVLKNVEDKGGESSASSNMNISGTTAPAVYNTGISTVAPSLSMTMTSGSSTVPPMGSTAPSLGEMSFVSTSQQQAPQKQGAFFMDMPPPASVVEPLFPSSNSSATTSPLQKPESSPMSYLGIIGKGSTVGDSTLSVAVPPKHQPGSFASVLAEAKSPMESTPSMTSRVTSTSSKKESSKHATTSKYRPLASVDGRHGDFKVFVKNLKDFSVNEIQELLGDGVRSITLKLSNKQPNGMCHMTFRTRNDYLTALNRNYEVIAPSIHLSINKDTSNESKFNIDNPVYFTYDEEESSNYESSALAQPSESTGESGASGNVLQSSLTGDHGDYFAFVRGLFYFNSYEVQSFLGDDVRSVTLKLDDDGRPNGMSHVTFNTQDGFNAAVGRNNEYIRGKQQLRIAPDTKKDFGNGSCRSVYFIRPHGAGRAAKEKRKARGAKKGSTAGFGNVKSSGSSRNRAGNAYGAFDDGEEWQTK
mmetsp:Transcript_8787/g.16456  ORF Transcript_8787/g.16456 Transcript_8787/m.16456 type:complete len:1501 (-) Transcript_8787:241-4743(-)